jgi:hypothetical protein
LPDVKKIVYVLNMGFKNKLFIYLPKVRLVTTVSNRKVPGQRDRDPFFGSCFELLFMWALAMEKIASVLPHRMRTQGTHESNSNSLIYKLDIHLILAKSEKSASSRLSKQLGIYGKLPSIPAPGANIRAATFCYRNLHLFFRCHHHAFPRARAIPAPSADIRAATFCYRDLHLFFAATTTLSRAREAWHAPLDLPWPARASFSPARARSPFFFLPDRAGSDRSIAKKEIATVAMEVRTC